MLIFVMYHHANSLKNKCPNEQVKFFIDFVSDVFPNFFGGGKIGTKETVHSMVKCSAG